jgi:RNA polymerase-binding transcription factor DksA
MNTRSTGVPATVESTAVARRSRNNGRGSMVRPGSGRWKLVLESRWQRKIDEVVILSQAHSGLASEPDETATLPGVRRSRQLGARIDAALGEVAAIEEALARVDDGNYGICAGCDRPMAAEWLADTPETRYCPDCSLHLVSWQPPSQRKVQAERRADAPAASAGAQRAAPKTAERKRRQARRVDSGMQGLSAIAR